MKTSLLVKTLLLFLLTTPLHFQAMKKVLIGAPVRQKPAILYEFLKSLEELSATNFSADFYFIDDNTDAQSTMLLLDFYSRHADNTIVIKAPAAHDVYICNEQTHYWNERIIWKVAAFKDSIFEAALEKSYDYVFLIDSDIVLHPKTIEQLIIDNKDIVSEIFWTHWQPGHRKSPQVWLYDTYTQYEVGCGESLSNEDVHLRHNEFISTLLVPGVYDVGGLGACTLISRHALEKGVRFRKLKNLTFWGEDRHFCIRAAALDLQMCVDTHYPAYHIYRESDLAGVEQFKENCRNDIYNI